MGQRKCYRDKTRRRRAKHELASGQEDHFRRLPAELLVFILTIVADLKSLCKCSIVSKLFASAVSRVQSVCVTIPRSSKYCEVHYESLKRNLPAPLAFLEKFRDLGSIYLEYNYLNDYYNSSVIKWKVKFSTNFPDIEKFVAFISASAQKQGGNEPRPLQLMERQNLMMVYMMDFYALSKGRGRYTEWILIIYMLAKSHTSLKKVIVTDSDKKGKMVIRDEQLVRIRSVDEPGERLFQFPPCVENFGTPLLRFSLSGYEMYQANLMIFTSPSETNARAIDEIGSWEFDDEEEVLAEAVKEMYKNHRDKFTTSQLW